MDCAGATPVAEAAADSGTPFAAGPVASIPLRLAAQEQKQMNLRLTPPETARRGERFDIVQRKASNGAIVGGIAVEMRVI